MYLPTKGINLDLQQLEAVQHSPWLYSSELPIGSQSRVFLFDEDGLLADFRLEKNLCQQ